MKVNYIGVNKLKTGGQYINFAIKKSKPRKPVTPPKEKYLVLDKGKLDVKKLK